MRPLPLPVRFTLVALALALAFVGVAASAGCQRSMAPMCRQICHCSRCTPLDFDTCVTRAETAQQSAEKSGCSVIFDTLVNCVEDNFSCGVDGAGPGTDQCARADVAMVLCDGSISPFGSACDEAAVRTQACTGMIPTPQVQKLLSCGGVPACMARCTLAQPCEVLNGTASKAPLTACINQCQKPMGGGPPPGGGSKHERP